MATTIKLKNGSGAPLAGDLVQGEPAFDLTNKRLYTEDSGGSVIEVGTNPTSLTTGTFTSTGIDDNATSTAITIDSSGNVGIGRTPGYRLDVEEASPTNGIVQRISATGSTGAQIMFFQSGVSNWAMGQPAGDDDFAFWSGRTSAAAGTERMRILNNGNVGIGASNPQYALDVVGNIRATNSSGSSIIANRTSNPGSIEFQYNGTQTAQFSAVSGGGVATYVGSTPAEAMRIDSSGQTMLSGSTAAFDNTGAVNGLQLHYTTTTGKGVIGTYSSGGTTSLAFRTNSGGAGAATDHMLIDGSGNVGIGTASPDRPLHVFGGYPTVKIERNAGTGGATAIALTNSTNTAAVITGSDTTMTFRIGDNADTGTGGSERMRIDSSGNVGIGISSLVNPLQVGVTSNTASKTSGSAFDGGALRLDGGLGTANSEVAILGGANDGLSSGIGFARQSSGDWGTQLRFYTHGAAITTTDELTERMRIDSSGNLLVGKTSSGLTTAGSQITSASILQSVSSTSTNLATNNGAAINLCNTSATDGNFSNIGAYNSNGLVTSQINFINPSHSSRTGAITFTTHSGSAFSERMRILSSGGLTFNGDTAAANALDDYEEGTWSPTISSGTASFANATYTKVGRVVVVTVFFQSVSDQSSATALQIGNLPFTSDSNTFSTSTGLSRHFNRGDGTIVTYIGGNNNVINFYALDLGADYLSVRHSDLNNAGANYYATITYIAA